MFKPAGVVVIIFFFTACNAPSETKLHNEDPVSHQPATLETFADSLVRLDKYAGESIETAGSYYQNLVPADSLLADSAAVILLKHIRGVVDTVNQKLWTDTSDYMDLVYPGGTEPTQKQKQFQQALRKNHLLLTGNGEGDVLAVLDYEWLVGMVQPKTSAAVDSYLSLLATEEKEPAMQDAELAIDMKELVERLITTENLAAKQLPESLKKDVHSKNRFYTDVLFVGSANSPSFDDELRLTLTPEFKKGYDYLLASFPASASARHLKDWLALIKAKDRKKIEERKASAYQE